jgi:hypothetical protein
MTIWHLFIVTAFFTPMIPAIQEPRTTHASVGAFVVSLFVGLVIGLVWSSVLWWLTTKIFRASSSRKDSSRLLIATAVALFSAVWVIAGEMFADQMTKLVLHIV